MIKYKIFDKLMSVKEASEVWDLSIAQIKQLCVQGKVVSKKIGSSWVILKNQENPKQRK